MAVSPVRQCHDPVRSSSKAELSFGRALPANLTSGGRISHHEPAFGTGELQEGGTTLLDGAFAPGRTTATPPWIGMPMLLRSQGSTNEAISLPDLQSRLPEPRPASRTAIRRSGAGAPSPPPLLYACGVPCRQRARETS